MAKEQVKPAQLIRLLPELWAQIDNQAEKEERSRNKMVELLIKRGLKSENIITNSDAVINIPNPKTIAGNVKMK